MAWKEDHIHIHIHSESEKKLDLIIQKLNEIKMTNAEFAQALTDAAAQVVKAKAEILQKVADLEAAVGSSGNTTPEIDAAFASLKDAIQGVDDIVPDAPVV